MLSQLLHGRVVPLEGGTRCARETCRDGRRCETFRSGSDTRAKVEAHDAWRNNMLIFEDTPLREIVERAQSRCDRRKLEIADPAIGDVRLGEVPITGSGGFLAESRRRDANQGSWRKRSDERRRSRAPNLQRYEKAERFGQVGSSGCTKPCAPPCARLDHPGLLLAARYRKPSSLSAQESRGE